MSYTSTVMGSPAPMVFSSGGNDGFGGGGLGTGLFGGILGGALFGGRGLGGYGGYGAPVAAAASSGIDGLTAQNIMLQTANGFNNISGQLNTSAEIQAVDQGITTLSNQIANNASTAITTGAIAASTAASTAQYNQLNDRLNTGQITDAVDGVSTQVYGISSQLCGINTGIAVGFGNASKEALQNAITVMTNSNANADRVIASTQNMLDRQTESLKCFITNGNLAQANEYLKAQLLDCKLADLDSRNRINLIALGNTISGNNVGSGSITNPPVVAGAAVRGGV